MMTHGSDRLEARMTIKGVASLVVMALSVAGATYAAGTPEDLAQAAAESWLKLTDAGNADASWEQAAALFKGALTKEQWAQMLPGVRNPLGKVISRKVASRQYAEKMPGAPDGKYVVIRFETVFEKKASAVETVVPMLDPDGVWRVSGYFIK